MSTVTDLKNSPNKKRIAKHFDAAAAGYDKAALIQSEIGERLFERLEFVDIAPELILDLGCGTGKWTLELSKRYKKAKIKGFDFSAKMIEEANKNKPWKLLGNKVSFAVEDFEALTCVEDGSVDIIFSNFAFQWCSDIHLLFAECKRVLKPGGLLMFTMPGPDTLKELRTAWAGLDDFKHLNQFIDMHDVGDALLKQGFFQPVMDMDMLSQGFEDCRTLLHSIKKTGAGTVLDNPRQGLTGKSVFKALEAQFEPMRGEDGLLPLTYEVVYGHAWAPSAKKEPINAANVIPIKMR